MTNPAISSQANSVCSSLRFARRVGVLAVREDRADDEFRTAARAQNLGAAKRMILQIGILLVVEIVQQRDDAPHFFVFAERARIATHRGLDGERMLPQALALGVLGQHDSRRSHASVRTSCS